MASNKEERTPGEPRGHDSFLMTRYYVPFSDQRLRPFAGHQLTVPSEPADAHPPSFRGRGSVAVFTRLQGRRLLDAPPGDTVEGLRDRAILSVGLQTGLRVGEITGLKVGDLYRTVYFDELRVRKDDGEAYKTLINPEVAQRIGAYMGVAGHGDRPSSPLFRLLPGVGNPSSPTLGMIPPQITKILQRYAKQIGLSGFYGPMSMRVTFYQVVRESGGEPRDILRAMGHWEQFAADYHRPLTDEPTKIASFLAIY